MPLIAPALLLLVGVPLAWTLTAATAPVLQARCWQDLFADPQTLPALGLSLWSGLSSTLLAYALTGVLLGLTFGRPGWPGFVRRLGPMLAVPHVSLALGLAALIAPSGWLLRLLSPWATGMQEPPPWATTQDPWALGLIAVLVLKETPFLLWAASAHLQQAPVARRLQQELHWAHTAGYGAQAAWWRVGWPQVQGSLRLPLLAVLAYGITVVDVALVIGPTSPATLGALAWQWLQDADLARNAQGAAAAWCLALCIVATAALAHALDSLPVWRRWLTRGPAPCKATRPVAQGCSALLTSCRDLVPGLLPFGYAALLLTLLAASVMAYWPFPALLPESWSLSAWEQVGASSNTLTTTLGLALASALSAWLWSVLWLECSSTRWRHAAQGALMLPLLMPGLLWVLGLHRMLLLWHWDAGAPGVWLAHSLACVPYVLLTLQGPYLGMDPRIGQLAASLGHGRLQVLWQVKWPLLRAPLAASLSVGIAVSVAQYLPTVYLGAGRLSTVSTEAVALSSGGQRALLAAYAWLLWLLPAAAFAVAALAGRPRRFSRYGHNGGLPYRPTP